MKRTASVLYQWFVAQIAAVDVPDHRRVVLPDADVVLGGEGSGVVVGLRERLAQRAQRRQRAEGAEICARTLETLV